MAKRFEADICDNGLARFAALATAGKTIGLRVIKTYSAGDSYATVVSNTCAATTLAAGDFTVANDSTTGRKVTTAAKSGVSVTANSGAGPDLHVAVTNNTDSTVLAVTDETTNVVLEVGGGSNTVDIPALTFIIPFACT